MTKSVSEIAHLFDVLETGPSNAGGEVYPGYPGLVIAEGQLRTMTWGFPLSVRGKSGKMLKPKPVNNTRTDKLAGPFWKSSFESRRCLIPVSAWAESEGETGRKTRSWVSMTDGEPFTIGGIWRWSEEWGEVYSMVMTDAAGRAGELHHRMPVIVAPEDRRTWTSGSVGPAFELCRPFTGEMAVERTLVPWSGKETDGHSAIRNS